MNREEKEDYLYERCKTVMCDKCVLNDTTIYKWEIQGLSEEVNCLNFSKSPEADLDKAIELIQESDELDKAHDVNKLAEAVNHPSHYNDGNIEVIDFIEDKKLGFHLGNAVKYISRAGKKDKSKEAEDIKKAIWYLNRYLDKEVK